MTATVNRPLQLDVEQCVDHIVRTFGDDIRIGMPLGLGKPVPLINALYRRAKRDSSLRLTIFTALSLEVPTWSSELERRFLQPFVERVWHGVPQLAFAADLRRGEMPPNVRVHDLFFKAGTYKGVPAMQQDHICSNYTHSVRDVDLNGNRIFAHMIAKDDANGARCYSASCNADTSLHTLRMFGDAIRAGERRLRIGMVNPQLPFMYGDAELGPESYDVIVDSDETDHALFSTPRLAVADADHLIGLHASALVKDGGTLQIGIGALGDAVAYGLALRHTQPAAYAGVLASSGIAARHGRLIDAVGGTTPFERGLYGSTEMLVDGFLQLYRAGVVKRAVFPHAGVQTLVDAAKLRAGGALPRDLLDTLVTQGLIAPYLAPDELARLQRCGVFAADVEHVDGHLVRGGRRYSALLLDAAHRADVAAACLGERLAGGVVLSGGFFIGPRDFYDALRGMPQAERRRFEMTGVDVANQLYGDERLRALQRRDARLCNTGMKATLLGAVVSDGLEDGTVVSGVGGQYNFVAMAHALPDARLVMMIKATRNEGGRTLSNIVFNYGHTTIPRHLRDIVVTEHGIADLRGRCDQDVIKAMLAVADSRFQDELLSAAKAAGKIAADYEIPDEQRHNTPQRIGQTLQAFKSQGLFPPFPFGSDFTREEMLLGHALKALKAKSGKGHEDAIAAALQGLPAEPPAHARPLLERMGVADPATRDDVALQKTVLLALRLGGIV